MSRNQYVRMKFRDGSVRTFARKSPNKSLYFHGRDPNLPRVRPLQPGEPEMYKHKKDGYLVQLLEQTAGGDVIYSQDGAEPITVTANQFFTDFEEAPASAETASAGRPASNSSAGKK